MNKLEDQGRLKNIIEKRLLRVPSEIKKFFPPVLSKPGVSFFTFSTDTYLILAFIDEVEKKRIEKLIKKGYHPFPGLIADDTSTPVAFRFKKSRNVFLERCTVENMFSLSLGGDSTVILCNHLQSINTFELGVYRYVVQLAYIISFGSEINRDNLYDFVEDLIAYSFKQWRSSDDR
ncbi:MAG: hypothetical protein KAT65_04305 [Methanophagales archaeon]|nr:hypothetical protein [Methanophagales archaeon]